MSNASDIIRTAVEAKTFEDAVRLNRMIEESVGERYERPVGDRWNNFGLMAQSGSYEFKALEPVTNMQDGELERLALLKSGDLSKVPYLTPHEAARDLLPVGDGRSVADRITVEFRESDPPTSRTKRLSIAYRDRGCGIEPGYVPKSIFALGSSHKTEAVWQQGAFGLGGASTYRNAEAVVLVTRRDPELGPEEDRIAVAVVVWEDRGKVRSAYYLTTTDWDDGGDPGAEPWSAPASEFSDFEPGTLLTLVSYGVEGFHRGRSGDERSFDTVLSTRLFDPVTPVRFTNATTRGRNEYLQGLHRRLEDNRGNYPDRPEGEERLPYNVRGETYQLPVRFYVFAAPGEAGERRNFVARDHALVFTSNGQVHHNWNPTEFRTKTKLNKLYNRVFIVVETDDLPIELRTALFTPDRSQLLASDDALRLENQVTAFLDDWDRLAEITGELVREAISNSSAGGSTIDVARKIGQALKVRGFSPNGRGGGGGGAGGGVKRKPIELYADPTHLEGPARVTAEDGATRFVRYQLNAKDDFMPARGELKVSCDHPEINDREISVGQLTDGYVRVSIAVPEGAALGEFGLEASVEDWTRAGGGLGAPYRFRTELTVVDEITRNGSGGAGSGGRNGTGNGKGVDRGGLVGVVWSDPESQPGSDWNAAVPGHVEQVPAKTLAEAYPEYASLAELGDMEIPTIVLNKEYAPYKQYISARARTLVRVDDARDRYAVGTGLGLLFLEQEFKKKAESGKPVDERVELDAKQAVARSVLTMMPAFDALVAEAGIVS